MTPINSTLSSTSSPAQPTTENAKPAETALAGAIDRTCAWLFEQQHADGHWCGELEGDTILESEYVLLLAFLGEEKSNKAVDAARYLLTKQNEDGGWSLFPGGPIDVGVAVKAYFALKLTGHSPEAEYMVRARKIIREHGGADVVNSFCRFYMAILNQIPYSACPAVPPEMMLLPNWGPINIYRMSAWSRTIFVPLSIVWAHAPVREIPAECGIEELFVKPVEEWPPLRCPGNDPEPMFGWESFFRTVDGGLKFAENWGIKPLRKRSLLLAEDWMKKRFEKSDGLGAIFPPIIWSIIALRCLGYSDDSPQVQECHNQLEALAIDDDSTGENHRRLQPCKSPVWDTAITLRALAAAGHRFENENVRKAVKWVLSKEVRSPGDWSKTVQTEPAGWFFEYNNEFYPDVDDTIMVIMALRDQLESAETDVLSKQPVSDTWSHTSIAQAKAEDSSQSREMLRTLEKILGAIDRGRRWVLAMQNKDGGWGAFDRDNDAEFLCKVPFADHNAMIDPSTPDITGRVVEALGQIEMTADHPAIEKAIQYVRDHQEEDGAWYGRWGVNYIYGVWQVIVGMEAIGISHNDPAIVRGADWLLKYQNEDGGWGESAKSYEDPTLRGVGPSTASQTAWAMLGLISAGKANHESVARGAAWLIEHQKEDGSWAEEEFTGTGFPLVFYLRYHYYRIYFPLLALGEYRRRLESEPSTPSL